MKKITVIGGGTGTYVVLQGLKKYSLNIAVIVSMMDSGGSTGKLRDQLGVMPPGDFRQCLVALSEAETLWRKLFVYRFESGDLKGHTFGNIFISALEKNTHNYQEVVDTASFILKTLGRVIPVTFDKSHLCAEYQNGEVLDSEDAIDTASHQTSRIIKAYLAPHASASPHSIDALKTSDYIVIGPGDLYTSLIPNLLVDGIVDALHVSSAPLIYIMNLMTKRGQTTNYNAYDHVVDLETYLKKKINIVIFNSSPLPIDIVSYYWASGEQKVEDDLSNKRSDIYCIYDNIISDKKHLKSQEDPVARSFLRHDSQKLAQVLWEKVLNTSLYAKNHT